MPQCRPRELEREILKTAEPEEQPDARNPRLTDRAQMSILRVGDQQPEPDALA